LIPAEVSQRRPRANAAFFIGNVPTSERGCVSRSNVNLQTVIRMVEPLLIANPLRVTDPRSVFSLGRCFCGFT
jgi:hypothetical protein